MSTDEFKEAARVGISFGRFRGQTIDDIAKTTQGLLWLDWCRGIQVKGSPLLRHLEAYLDDPVIAKALSEALDAS